MHFELSLAKISRALPCGPRNTSCSYLFPRPTACSHRTPFFHTPQKAPLPSHISFWALHCSLPLPHSCMDNNHALPGTRQSKMTTAGDQRTPPSMSWGASPAALYVWGAPPAAPASAGGHPAVPSRCCAVPPQTNISAPARWSGGRRQRGRPRHLFDWNGDWGVSLSSLCVSLVRECYFSIINT